MSELKGIIEDIGNSAFESNIKIAALAVVSISGKVLHQTENFDLRDHADTLLNAMKGEKSFIINDLEYSVTRTPSEGIIGTNKGGMGFVIVVPFQGGLLVSYALPKADPTKALAFLKTFAYKLDGKV